MKYHARLKNLHKIASKEMSRYTMTAIEIDAKQGTATATNGRALTTIDIADLLEPGEESFLLPREAIVAAQALVGPKKEKREVLIRCSEGIIAVTIKGSKRGQTFAEGTGKFPEWKTLAPESMEAYKAAITLNPEILLAIANAATADGMMMGVTIYTKDSESAFLVAPFGSHKSYSLMMPMLNIVEPPKAFWRKRGPQKVT